MHRSIHRLFFVSLQKSQGRHTSEDPSKDPQYAEPAVDTMRKQKDEVTWELKQSAEINSTSDVLVHYTVCPAILVANVKQQCICGWII